MRRATWAVVILWGLLMLTSLVGPDPPDSAATLLGEALATFALLYFLIAYAPMKVRGWWGARAEGS